MSKQPYDKVWQALDDLATFMHNEALNPGSMDRVLVAISKTKKVIDEERAQDHQRIRSELVEKLDEYAMTHYDSSGNGYEYGCVFVEDATKAIEAVLGTELAPDKSSVRKEENHQEGSL